MIIREFYNDAPNYCHYFFDLVKSENLLLELENSKIFTEKIIDKITPQKENFSYEPNKWTTKEVLRHIIDCERVYTYRALRFSRLDNTELTGFDENKYIENLKNIDCNLDDLRFEYLSVRNSTISLYKTMTEKMLNFKGLANNVYFTAKSLGFMTIGHNLHHCNFIMEKYLSEN